MFESWERKKKREAMEMKRGIKQEGSRRETLRMMSKSPKRKDERCKGKQTNSRAFHLQNKW